ncbi:hypothetical protein B0H16DRAFT_1725435 [Mycena metata]|uniref:Uncharacterized protein n=1 Tax=Mycena metata TaxID=1033252 RepID=A0AAD7ISC6_9AGAR|nr:hypothetical protein B0H16DRAFT_1725435 [Mycena metata]
MAGMEIFCRCGGVVGMQRSELAKFFLKNRRNTEYRAGRLEVSEKYQYLKANTAKWNPTVPRGKQNKRNRAVIAKRREKVKASAGKGKGKGRAKRVLPASDGEEEDEVDYVPGDEDEKGGSDDNTMDVE